MRSILLWLLPGIAFAQTALRYELTPAVDPSPRSVSVRLTIQTDGPDSTELSLPNDYGGQDQFGGIRDLRLVSGGALLPPAGRPDMRMVRHAPRARLVVEYRVEEVRTGGIELGNHYQAVIRDNIVHALGNSWMIVPSWDDSTEAEFVWHGAPAGWKFASSFGLGPGPLRARLSVDWLRHSIWLAGDLRMRETVVNDRAVAVALIGTWTFDDAALLRLVRSILQTERDFFDDHEYPFFLVTALQIDGDNDQGGTGRINSFGLFLSDDRTIDLRLKRLLAHEIFHTWNGDRTERESPEALLYWFTEGFADYFARRFLLQSNLITPQEYLNDFNAVLREYNTSSMRTMPNSALVDGSVGGRDVQRMPYRRGDILAHWFAASADERGRSLDSVVRSYLIDAMRRPGVIARASLFDALRPLLSDEDRPMLSGWVDGSVPIDPQRVLFTRGAELSLNERRRYYVFGDRLVIPAYRWVEEGGAARLRP